MGKKKGKLQKRSSSKKTGQVKPPRFTGKSFRWALITVAGFALAVVLILWSSDWPVINNFFASGESEEVPGIASQRESLLPSASSNMAIQAPKTRFEDFAGSETCKECHPKEYRLWANSTHGKAGGEPGKVRIIAKFNGQPLYFKDAVVTPSVNENGDYIFTVEQSGQPAQIIKVDAVVGGGHMVGGGTQSFFTRFPDGSLRFLPFDFIRKENIWFVQLRAGKNWVPISRDIALSDLEQWPPHRMLGTQEGTSNCQNCHGSQILLEYFPAEKQYRTRYQTLQINCESCHGPGKKHIELIKSPNAAELTDIGMEPLAALSKDQSLVVCFQCHAVKDPLRDSYLPGDNLENFFSLKLPLLGSEPYLPDGRVRLFAYQQNHLFSDCYINGSMACGDCHDPHSQTYRDVFGKPLQGKFDNGQCTGCHASKGREPQLHSHHKAGSEGNLCTSCHMPFLQHRVVGQQLVFARSDHVIPIPRPAFDANLGIENACRKCHGDKSIPWLQAKTEEWYGKVKPHNEIITNILQAETVHEIEAASQLLLQPDNDRTINKVMGLTQFAKRFLRPDMPSLNPEVIAKLVELSKSEDIDLKALSLMSLHLSAGQDEKTHAFLLESLRDSKEKENAIRRRWALAIDYLGSVYASEGAFTDAVKAHKKALEINPGDAFAWTNLARAYRYLGNFNNAIASLKKVLQINPYEASGYFQLAELYIETRQKAPAIESLQEGLKYEPDNPQALQMLRELGNFQDQR